MHKLPRPSAPTIDLWTLAAITVLIAFAPSTKAQVAAWKPDRPVTIVVPYAPGGSVDAMARAVGRALTSRTGQPVIVENQPGADGLIGSRRVVDSKPDGATLLFQIPAFALTKHMPGLKGIDPLSQLAPITSFAETPALLVGSAKVPATTLKSFVQHCRAATEPCSMGTAEATGRLRAKQIAADMAIPNLISVNYRGTGPIMSDLISGVVSMSQMNLPAVQQHYRNGTVRILAVQDSKRSPLLPEVPTVAELGFPQFATTTWYGLFAPKGTPSPVLDSIAKAFQEIRNDPDLQRTIASAGAVAIFNSPAEFNKQVKQEEVMWGQLVKLYPLD